MGKHAEWRKIAKKVRRKRIRQLKAVSRDQIGFEEGRQKENSPRYRQWIEEQKQSQEYQEQEEARIHAEQEANWRKVEEEAQKQWVELQKKVALAKEERAKQNALIKLEWEKEQKKLKELEEQKQKELEEKRKLQEKRDEEINTFLETGGDTPEHLKTELETHPGKPLCPFFQKTFTCRFYDACSRNHIRPGISNAILITNFFTHYSLETLENEHGTDSSLEYENEETNEHYKEFFNDVVPEMEKCGRIRQFRTSCNHEPHLRGNVYVEYSTTRAALVSYRTFNGRWYAGKQLNVEFCKIPSWKSAICGLHFRNRCPKGNACNFLHVFQNPKNLYAYIDDDSQRSKRSSRRRNDRRDKEDSWDTPERTNWRWSESPERTNNLHSEWDDSESEIHFKSRRSEPRKRKIRDRHRSKERISRSKTPKRSKRRSRSKSRTPKRSSRKSRSCSKTPKGPSGASKSSKRRRRRSKSSSRCSQR